jgi:hypothetical protein
MNESPMTKRWREVKDQNPDCLVLFRMGDFYESFYEDAKTLAAVIGLTLTTRNKASDSPIPMAGFPYHQLDNYLRKLVANDQVATDPANGGNVSYTADDLASNREWATECLLRGEFPDGSPLNADQRQALKREEGRKFIPSRYVD